MNSALVPANLYEAQNAYIRLQSCLSSDDLKTAILEIKTFLKIFPDVAIAYNDLGVLNYRSGEKLIALACYEKANRLQNGTPSIIKNLAEFYFVELGWTDDAIMMLTGLLQLYPQDCEILTTLGTISERIGRENEACSFYRRALDLDPSNAAVREALARIEGSTSVVAGYQPVAPVQPVAPKIAAEPTSHQSPQLDDLLARLRASMNTKAAPSHSSPVKTADDLYREAKECIDKGDNDKAIASLESLIASYPACAVAFNDLGVLYTNLGDIQKALSYHEMALEKNPENPNFRKNLAALYYSCLGRTDEAIDIFTSLLREKPDDVDTLTSLAIISKANHLQDQSRTFIKKVLELEPWNIEAREFLAGL